MKNYFDTVPLTFLLDAYDMGIISFYVQNIDLCALTGWIPERSSLKNDDVNKDRLFDRLFEGLHRGI